ncbi:MAG TPA: DUF4157 domain-containing protein [Gaiellaceae bacterium]|nr:DUF4157 domain-containing protein [Gaiellaceae bacterium]
MRQSVSPSTAPGVPTDAQALVGRALSSTGQPLAGSTVDRLGPRLRPWLARGRRPSDVPAVPGALALGRSTDPAEPSRGDVDAVAAGAGPADPPLTRDERRVLQSVRVYADSGAAASAAAVRADAYTVGSRIAFARDRYAPSTDHGRRLLAHELIHAVARPEPVVRRQEAEPGSPGFIGPPTLIQTYRIAVREGRWQDAAEILNGFNRLDIETELAALSDAQVAQLHGGALANPRVGGGSQLAQMTDPSAPRASIEPPPTPQSPPPVPRRLPAAATSGVDAAGADAVTIASSGGAVTELSPAPATQQRLMEIIRTGGPLPSGARARVIGAAIVDVPGFTGAREIRAISSSETDALGQGAPVFHATTPTTRTITAARSIAGSQGEFPFSHVNDAEIKLFEYIAAHMPPGATGRISILTVRSRDSGQTLEPIPACSSCTNALFQVAGRFRGVEVGSYAPVRPTGSIELGSSSDAERAAEEQAVQGGGTGGTTAMIGTPDMRGLEVGGPSARGTAVVAGVQLAFMGANFVLNLINDHIQEQRAREALDAIRPALEEARRNDPSQGILLVFFYSQFEASPDSLIQPGAVFGHVEHSLGHTRDEARDAWHSTPSLRTGYTSGTREIQQEIWVPPTTPVGPQYLRTPFRTAALARFAAGRTTLQDVEWGGITGFDDEGTTSLADAASARFFVLRVPRSVSFDNGGIRYDVNVPVEERAPHAGAAIPTVNLDPVMPGDVHAAALFPADEETDALFATAHATYDNLGQLDHYTNFDKVRWARPENLDIG